MTRTRMMAMIAAALLFASCSGQEVREEAAPAAEPSTESAAAVAPKAPEPTAFTDAAPPAELDVSKVREIAEIAVEIEKDPGRAAEILADHGISVDRLEGILYDIAQDPVLAKTFQDAKRDVR